MPIEAVMAAPDRYRPVEPRLLRLQPGLAIMGAGQLHDAGAGEQGAEPIPGGGGGQVVGDEVGHGGDSFASPDSGLAPKGPG